MGELVIFILNKFLGGTKTIGPRTTYRESLELSLVLLELSVGYPLAEVGDSFPNEIWELGPYDIFRKIIL